MGIVCAFMVLFIHLPCGKDATALTKWIHSFFSHGVGKMAVPFFFVASGYLLAGHFGEDGWWRKAVKKRFRTLWVPMVVWCSLYFLWTRIALPVTANLLAGNPFWADVGIIPTWTDLTRILSAHPFYEPYLGVLWFVRMLFILVLFSPILKKFATPWGVASLYVLLAIVGPELGGTPPSLRFTFLKGFLPICGSVFFCLGIMLRERCCVLSVPKSYGFMALAISFAAIAVRGQPYSSRLATMITWAYVPFLIVGVWSICPARRFPDFLVKAAFPVYVMHMFAIRLFRLYIPTACIDADRYLLLGFFCFASCVATSWLMRKYLPKCLCSILFGGR